MKQCHYWLNLESNAAKYYKNVYVECSILKWEKAAVIAVFVWTKLISNFNSFSTKYFNTLTSVSLMWHQLWFLSAFMPHVATEPHTEHHPGEERGKRENRLSEVWIAVVTHWLYIAKQVFWLLLSWVLLILLLLLFYFVLYIICFLSSNIKHRILLGLFTYVFSIWYFSLSLAPCCYCSVNK